MRPLLLRHVCERAEVVISVARAKPARIVGLFADSYKVLSRPRSTLATWSICTIVMLLLIREMEC